MTTLNYNLSTTTDRLNHLNNLPLHQLSESQIEHYTNYLLHYETDLKRKQSSNALDNKYEELNPNLPPQTNHYINKTKPLDWNHPALAQLHEAITTLKTLTPTSPLQKYLHSKALRELSQDAKYHLPTFFNKGSTFSPTLPPQPDYTLLIEWDNPNHLYHCILHHSSLNDYDLLAHLHRVYQNAKPYLSTEERKALRLLSTGYNVRETREQLPVSGSILRRLAKKLAASGEALHRAKAAPTKYCPSCKTHKPNIPYYFYTKKKYCRACETQRRHSPKT